MACRLAASLASQIQGDRSSHFVESEAYVTFILKQIQKATQLFLRQLSPSIVNRLDWPNGEGSTVFHFISNDECPLVI